VPSFLEMRGSSIVLGVLLLAAACETRFSLGSVRPKDVSMGGGQGEDAGTDVGACDPRGALFDVGDGPGVRCAGGLRRGFRHALCSCGDLQSSGSISVDAFDSDEGAYTPGDASGSIGVNGALYGRTVEIGGSLWVHDANGIPLGADLRVGANLFDQGQLDGSPHSVFVGGAARVGGAINVRHLEAGSLLVNPASTVAVTDGAPPYTAGVVAVPAPCDCAGAPDVPALVAAHATDNDNARIGLDPKEGMRSLAGVLELTLPCGRYYVDAFYAPNPIILTVTGPVELYVRGSMVADRSGTIDIQFTSGGEIDLFVEKGFSVANRFQVGWPNAPGRARIHAGGEDTLFFSGPTLIGGSLYAPGGRLVTAASFELYGAMVVQRVDSSAALLLHYDRALARDVCEPGTCPAGESCGVLACVAGGCIECTTDAECGADYRCDKGLCLP
jgi:hypothetical protein